VSAPQDTYDAATCTACRGTGEVISTLGGTPHRVPCPWCEGEGRYLQGHDAQAAALRGQPADH
jgi:DnaJ-class molecular chaperone